MSLKYLIMMEYGGKQKKFSDKILRLDKID